MEKYYRDTVGASRGRVGSHPGTGHPVHAPSDSSCGQVRTGYTEPSQIRDVSVKCYDRFWLQ